ncbi:Unr [Drosophila busckii]|uniref:Unr n=1 Tax=Drosophila busckii TaxID=30019 RepID=A0A0M4EY92_DROBS|nr:Unr [Drosophila busckii]
MNTQSKGYRTGEAYEIAEIYDMTCFDMTAIRNLNIPTTFPTIGTFTLDSATVLNNSVGSSSIYGSQSSNSSAAASADPSQTTRETGIIEKLLHSYGFIQCCERQARLLFHFSQFSGNIDHLKIGDPVEFEMTYDRRTGKPIASQVSKIAPEVVLSEERVTGTVTTELRTDSANNVLSSSETTGRISYENRGECFFLPYTKDDVEGNVNLRAGDKVSFQIATNQRGNLGACHIRLENPAQPVKYRGVVCSMKESFGFIERADVVKEIFFHFSEAEGNVELRPGDDVEFTIQTRSSTSVPPQGREYACNITRLPPGSVIFEDVDSTIYKGQVLKSLERNNAVRQNNDPLPGRIRYRAADYSEVEVPFGEKDQKGDFTLRHGDWVQFLLATDRRDQLQRATSIALLDETFKVSGEKREQGTIASLKEGFGFLRCVERQARLFFHFTEVLDTSREIEVNDEVEFTVIQEPGLAYNNSRLQAIRIQHLPANSVQFETLMASAIEAGCVTREAPKSPIKSQDRVEGGVITYEHGDAKKTIMYFLKDCEKPPRIGERVRFDIYMLENNNHASAEPTGQLYRGFIAVIKENFGFIETISHDEEVFFHFSNYQGNPNWLELGQEVEYTLAPNGNTSVSGNCLPAENVRTLPKNSIPQPALLENVHNGVVARPLRCINPEQQEYAGLIEIQDELRTTCISQHEFGITSLVNKRDLLQKGDLVRFRIDESGRAAEVNAVRLKKRATVDSIKGQFGFLNFEVEDGKKLFFHMSEVQGSTVALHPGDTVEFSVVTNQRNGKSSACNVLKINDRPDRLISRLKLNGDDGVPRLILMRAPKGPQGKGFSVLARHPRIPGKQLAKILF